MSLSATLGHFRHLHCLGSRVMGGKLTPPTPGSPVQNNSLKTNCRLPTSSRWQKNDTFVLFLLPYGGSSSPGTPQDGSRAVFGRKEAACCLTQSGSSSPWKQLSEPRDAAAVLEPVVRAPLLPSGGSRSPGPPKRL